MTVASPCTRICTLDAADECIGCGRTIGEIVRWSAADDDERRAIAARATLRRAARAPAVARTDAAR